MMRRYQAAILLFVIAVILAVVLVQAVADAYTNYLWYRSINETMIWRSMVETKLGLGAVFSVTFFLACWISLWAVDRLSPADVYLAPEYDLVRRYRASFGRYRITVRTVVSVLLALAVGAGTSSQWQHWLLFVNGGKFGIKDPQFGRDVGFYVFRLPFLSFLVDWSLVALVVLFVVTATAYYLNGGLRTSGPSPRIDGQPVAHLSLLLALAALVRAAAYFFVDRYALDLSTNGVVAGAGYTDVHVRLPALSVLAVVSMIGFVLLSYNVYHRTLVFPAVAVGLWAFIALMLGVIFPAFVQWLQVNPSQSTVELPYIQRNIAFTRDAFGLNSITPEVFDGHAALRGSAVTANRQSLSDLPLWNPAVAAGTYDNLQALHGYYSLSGLSTDRYMLGSGSTRTLTPVVIGVRELLSSGVPQTWVNQHLEYTHGYGVVMSPANTSTTAGLPQFAIQGAPVQSTSGAPSITEPDIYFGKSSTNFVVVHTRQPELDYLSRSSGRARTTQYHGSGGVQLTGFWQRAAFAMRFHDFNLLVSHLITPKSRILYLQGVETRVQHAAPFLKVDSHPYPVVAGGQVFWVVDCYTTSDYFPYSQAAATGLLPSSSGLQGQYNYVRDSVKAVVNAYTGQVSLFAVTSHDPVLTAWEHAYPGLFHPLSAMANLTPSDRGALLNHLRYPQDLLTVLTEMYGRYHFLPTANQASSFYSLQDAWDVAAGANGAPYTPAYELIRLPGQSSVSFVALEPFVPQSSTGRSQLLAGFITAESDYSNYGNLTAYELPRVSPSAVGPTLAAAKIQTFPSIARAVTLLGQNHSEVLLGPALLVPIDDSVIYVQALYVSSTAHSLPALEYVATDFGGDKVGFSSTLLGSLQQIFGHSVTDIGRGSPQSISEQIAQDLNLAYAAYEKSVVDGKHFRLGAFQQDLQQMGEYLGAAHRLIAEEAKHPATRPSTGQGSSTVPGGTPSSPGTSAPATSSSGTKASSLAPAAGSTTSTTGAPRVG